MLERIEFSPNQGLSYLQLEIFRHVINFLYINKETDRYELNINYAETYKDQVSNYGHCISFNLDGNKNYGIFIYIDSVNLIFSSKKLPYKIDNRIVEVDGFENVFEMANRVVGLIEELT